MLGVVEDGARQHLCTLDYLDSEALDDVELHDGISLPNEGRNLHGGIFAAPAPPAVILV